MMVTTPGKNAIAKSLELLADFQVEIVKIPNRMDPDEFVQQHSPEALAELLQHSRISSVEFLIDHLKPENMDNLQSQIAYVEHISQIIAQAPSITAQNSYINKVADLLPDFDYFQVEQSVNALRLQDRQSLQQGQASQPKASLVTLPINKSMTALAKTESHLLHRLLHHDYLLNEFRHRPDFYFDTPALQTLYEQLKATGQITSYDLSQLSEEVNQAYYRVLEENLPDEIASGEIEDILSRQMTLLKQRELHRQGKQIRESSSKGDHQMALEALERFIAEKRKME